MGKVYRRQRIEGVTVPAVIHNNQYFWHNMAVYEDGTVSCWNKTDLSDVPRQLSRGWLMPSVPVGKTLGVFHCCSLEILSARWSFNEESYCDFVAETVRSINPEMANIYETTPREREFWKERRIGFTAAPTYCKTGAGKIGYDMLDGENSHILLRRDGKIFLTELYAYSDGTFSIDDLGGKYFTLDDIEKMFYDKTLVTAPKDGETVTLGALGEAECKAVYSVKRKDKLEEIKNSSLKAQKLPDAHDRCMESYFAYLVDPCDFTREKLREAYEAVPEHERCYLGNMDTRDSDFIRILQTDNKREV